MCSEISTSSGWSFSDQEAATDTETPGAGLGAGLGVEDRSRRVSKLPPAEVRLERGNSSTARS